MLIAIAERLSDVAHDVDVAHADLVVSLSVEDAGSPHLGYAVARVAAPSTRFHGAAVVVGDAALAGVPDPVRILVRDQGGRDPAVTLVVRRKALPLLIRADLQGRSAMVLRRVAPAGEADDPVVSTQSDDVAGTADRSDEE